MTSTPPRNLITTPEPKLSELPALAHPNLLFDAAGLQELRAKRKDPAAEAVLQEMIALCNTWLDPANKDNPDWRTLRDPLWRTRRGGHVAVRTIELCSFVYAVTGERKYGEFARDLLMGIIAAGLADHQSTLEWKAFHTVENYPGWRHGAGHDFGNYSMAMAVFYDVCQDLLTADDRKAFLKHAEESMRIEETLRPEIGRMALNNRGARCALGNAMLALAVYGEADHELVRWSLMTGLRLGGAWANHALGIDGGSFEGSSYCITTAVMLAQFGKAAARRGLRDLSQHPHHRRLADFLFYNIGPTHDHVLPINDCTRDLAFFGLLVLGAVHRDGVAMWLYRELRQKLERLSYADMLPAYAQFQYHDPKVKPVHPRDAGYPLAKHFRDRGVVSALSDWTPQASQIIFFSGQQCYGAHRQDDQNSFTFCALGDRFAWDGGYDDFAGVYADRGYRKSEYHNLILIDGRGQTGYDGDYHPRGFIQAFEDTGKRVYTRGDASRCYGINGVIERADRQILFQRGKFPFVVIVDDLVVGSTAHDFTFNFVAHPATKLEERSAGRYALTGPKAAMDLVVLGSSRTRYAQDMAGNMPRLQATMHGKRGRFASLLLPRSPGLKASDFKATFNDKAVRVSVTLNGKKSQFTFGMDGVK